MMSKWVFCLALLFPLVAIPALRAQDHAATNSPAVAISDEVPCAALSASDPRLAPLAQLCDFARKYRESLPNFLCSQQTLQFRSAEDRRPPDVVTATVTYEAGRQRYSDIALNRTEPVKKIEDVHGLRSWGEFGASLVMLFARRTVPDFNFERTATVRGVPVVVFGFHVPSERNFDWELSDGHKRVRPEFRGELFVTDNGAKLMREELSTVELPGNFGLREVKTSTDFEMVPLTGGGTFLLPVRSSTLACKAVPGAAKGKSVQSCAKNYSEFRGCRRFGSESRVVNAKPLDE